MFKIITVSLPIADGATGVAEKLLAKIAAKIGAAEVKFGVLVYDANYGARGWLAEVVKHLPFPTIGFSTSASAVTGNVNAHQISLMAFSGGSLEVSFGRAAEITPHNYQSVLTDSYRAARAKLSGEPKLLLLFPPSVFDWRLCDAVTAALTQVSGGKIPIFGSAHCAAKWAADGNFCDGGVLADGEHRARDVAYALVSGDFAPKFFISSAADLPPMLPIYGKITEVDGYLLKAIDHMPPKRFFFEYGEALTLHHSQLWIKSEGESPNSKAVAGAVFAVTPEGYLNLSVKAPRGATVSLLRNDYDAVMQTAQAALKALAADCRERGGAALIFSCVIRQTVLRQSYANAEAFAIQNTLGETPFLLAYSGTEICPTVGGDGMTYDNCARTCSLIAMILA